MEMYLKFKLKKTEIKFHQKAKKNLITHSMKLKDSLQRNEKKI